MLLGDPDFMDARTPRGTKVRQKRTAKRREPQREDSAQLLDLVLVAAARILDEEGWDRVTTNRVAKLAGVSVGFVYRYFPNRDALGRAVMHRAWDDELRALGEAVMGGADTPTAVTAYVRHIAKNVRFHAEASMHLVPLVAEDATAWDKKVIALLVAAYGSKLEPARSALVFENIYVAVISVVRRAAHVNPETLLDGRLERELSDMVRGYMHVAEARPRP